MDHFHCVLNADTAQHADTKTSKRDEKTISKLPQLAREQQPSAKPIRFVTILATA